MVYHTSIEQAFHGAGKLPRGQSTVQCRNFGTIETIVLRCHYVFSLVAVFSSTGCAQIAMKCVDAHSALHMLAFVVHVCNDAGNNGCGTDMMCVTDDAHPQ